MFGAAAVAARAMAGQSEAMTAGTEPSRGPARWIRDHRHAWESKREPVVDNTKEENPA